MNYSVLTPPHVFAGYSINSILFQVHLCRSGLPVLIERYWLFTPPQRGVYPPSNFTQVPKYGLTMLVTNDSKLQEYLNHVLKQIRGSVIGIYSGRSVLGVMWTACFHRLADESPITEACDCSLWCGLWWDSREMGVRAWMRQGCRRGWVRSIISVTIFTLVQYLWSWLPPAGPLLSEGRSSTQSQWRKLRAKFRQSFDRWQQVWHFCRCSKNHVRNRFRAEFMHERLCSAVSVAYRFFRFADLCGQRS